MDELSEHFIPRASPRSTLLTARNRRRAADTFLKESTKSPPPGGDGMETTFFAQHLVGDARSCYRGRRGPLKSVVRALADDKTKLRGLNRDVPRE